MYKNITNRSNPWKPYSFAVLWRLAQPLYYKQGKIMNLKKSIFLTICLIVPSFVFADGWSDGKILEVRIQPSYNRILVVQENATNPDECDKTDFATLIMKDTFYHKDLHSALLSAYAIGRTTSLRLMGCTQYGRPEIKEIWLK